MFLLVFFSLALAAVSFGNRSAGDGCTQLLSLALVIIIVKKCKVKWSSVM